MLKIIICSYILSVIIAVGIFIPLADDGCEKTYEDVLFIILFSLFWFIFIPVYIYMVLAEEEKFNGFRYWFKNKNKVPQHGCEIPDPEIKRDQPIIIDLSK